MRYKPFSFEEFISRLSVGCCDKLIIRHAGIMNVAVQQTAIMFSFGNVNVSARLSHARRFLQ